MIEGAIDKSRSPKGCGRLDGGGMSLMVWQKYYCAQMLWGKERNRGQVVVGIVGGSDLHWFFRIQLWATCSSKVRHRCSITSAVVLRVCDMAKGSAWVEDAERRWDRGGREERRWGVVSDDSARSIFGYNPPKVSSVSLSTSSTTFVSSSSKNSVRISTFLLQEGSISGTAFVRTLPTTFCTEESPFN